MHKRQRRAFILDAKRRKRKAMIPNEGYRESGYTIGETRALIAPLFGCTPDEIGEIVIIVSDTSEMNVGVHTTMHCQIKAHWQARAIALMSDGIKSIASAIHTEAPGFHGPGE
jgi:hypothetical protein